MYVYKKMLPLLKNQPMYNTNNLGRLMPTMPIPGSHYIIHQLKEKSPLQAMKAHGMWIQGSTYTQSRHQKETGWLVLCSATFTPGKVPGTHFIGG